MQIIYVCIIFLAFLEKLNLIKGLKKQLSGRVLAKNVQGPRCIPSTKKCRRLLLVMLRLNCVKRGRRQLMEKFPLVLIYSTISIILIFKIDFYEFLKIILLLKVFRIPQKLCQIDSFLLFFRKRTTQNVNTIVFQGKGV